MRPLLRGIARVSSIAIRGGHRFSVSGGPVLAGYFAYIAMLAFFPFLIFASALTGFVIGPEGAAAALDVLFEPVPEHVARTLEPVVSDVIGERRGGILTLSGVGALWAASNGVDAIRLGFEDAYCVDARRRYALNRVYLLGIVVLGVVCFMALATLIILAPLAFGLLERVFGIHIPMIAGLVRYAVGLGILYALIWALHRLLPSRPMGGMKLWPGVLATALIWGAAATGLSVYLAYAPSYTITYGALAGVILTLLFFYLTGVALLVGAHVNAVVNGIRSGATTGGAGNGRKTG